MIHRSPPRVRAGLCGCALLIVLAGPVPATGEDQAPPPGPAASPPAPDFFFGRPKGSVSVRGSWLFARAGSDIFDFVTEQLTLERGAFSAPSVAADLAFTLTRRLDLVIGVDRSASSTPSEYRDFVDNNRQPITQKTDLRVYNTTASVRLLLADRGRGVSRFAWIPNTVTPYVGGGVGAVKYRFRQSGDFVDAVTLRVFSSLLESEGWTASVHAMGGVDVRLFRKLYLTAEGRYVFAAADLGEDFSGFDPIDLSGFRAGAGIRVTF